MEKINWLDNKWGLLVLSVIYIDTVVTGSVLWMTVPLYLIIIVRYIVRSRGYEYSLYVHSIFLLVALETVLLICVYLFDSAFLKIPVNFVFFLFFVLATVLLIILCVRSVVNGEL